MRALNVKIAGNCRGTLALTAGHSCLVIHGLTGKRLSEQENITFYLWLLVSLLLHMLGAALLLQPPARQPDRPSQPVAIQVFTVTPAKPAPVPLTAPRMPINTAAPVKAAPTQPLPSTRAPKGAARRPAARQQQAIRLPGADSDSALTARAPTTTVQTPEIATLLDTIATRTARRELSAAEIAALSAPATAPATNNSSIRRPVNRPGSGPAADVLETLPDGSQLVRVGKACVLAAPGADLRKDIHSIKVVGCGAGGRDERTVIDTQFEQVMSKVGQHR